MSEIRGAGGWDGGVTGAAIGEPAIARGITAAGTWAATAARTA